MKDCCKFDWEGFGATIAILALIVVGVVYFTTGDSSAPAPAPAVEEAADEAPADAAPAEEAAPAN